MKNLYATLVAICLNLSYLSVYAIPDGEEKMMLSQIDAIDYIMLIGGGLFLFGMLFILLSIYTGLKKKDEVVYDDIEDDCDSEPEENEDDNTEQAKEEAATEIETETEPESVEETDDIEETEHTEEADEIEETCENIEEETVSEDVAEIIEETDKKNEKVVRLTLTGTNNADVKIAEFTQSAKVGRRGTNDIMISDNAVSGEHCEFIYEDDVVYIRDLNSTNGTLLNDEVIEKEEVKTGDLIIVGKHQYKVNISV